MYKENYSLYLGQESEDKKINFFAKDNIFIIAVYPTGDKELVDQLFQDFKNKYISNPPLDLASFTKMIDQCFISSELFPTDFSAGYIIDSVIYLITKGQGRILLNRQQKLTTLVKGESLASGYIKDDDLFIIASDNFIRLFNLSNWQKSSDLTPKGRE